VQPAAPVVTYRDQGVGPNHLLEPAALTIIVVAGLWGSTTLDERQRLTLRLGIAAVILAALIGPLHSQLYPQARRAVDELRGFGNPYPLAPLSGYVRPGQDVLSEDAYVPVSIGERPIVLDLFMYRRLVKSRPGWQASLARRVSDAEFDKIVLTLPVEVGFDTGHFGGEVSGAIEKAYYLSGYSGLYWIYSRDADGSFCTPKVRGPIVRFCGPASGQLSTFPGVTFRGGTCVATATNGSVVLTAEVGSRFAGPRHPDDNDGLSELELIVTGSLDHPTGGGVIAYWHGRKWFGTGVSVRATGTTISFAATGIGSSVSQASGEIRCGSTFELARR
jgi:hypothetical protein